MADLTPDDLIPWLQRNFIPQANVNVYHSDLSIAEGFSRLLFPISRETLRDGMRLAGFRIEQVGTSYCFNVSDSSPAFAKLERVFE